MSRLLTAAAVIALMSPAAFAADLPVEAPPPIAPLTPAYYDWSGFYIGVQGGWGWGESDIDDGLLLNESLDLEGFFIGGLAGAQWQWNWAVLGAEIEGNWADIDGDAAIPPPAGNEVTTDINAFGSLSGKLGVAWDRILLYGTGGLAVGNIETGQTVPAVAAFDQDETYIGWTAGGGVDFAATNNLILGVKYRFYDFGEEEFTTPAPFTDRDQDVHLHTVSGHATWKF
jgi:outer membrane immunogenic protein